MSADANPIDLHGRLSGDIEDLEDVMRELARPRNESASVQGASSARIHADERNVEQGLAKLVLTLIEFLRQLLEKQAIRRIEAGSVTDDEIERMGETFLKLKERMAELKAAFGLAGEELNVNLGPLGNLV
jgi:hypothetical protein